MQTVTPNLSAARFNAELGLHYLQFGKINSAKEKFNLALEQAPNDPLVLDALGFYYEKIGAHDLANQYYFNALLIAPHSGTIRSNYGAFLCRNGYVSEGVFYLVDAAKTPHYPHARNTYQYARYCAEYLHNNVGDNTEYNYYRKMLNQSSPIQYWAR